MATRERMELLLQEFGGRLGLRDLALDDFGRCILWFDERLEVSFEYEPASDQLILECDLGTPTADRIPQVHQEALEFNASWPLTHASVVVLDPDAQHLVLRASYSTAQLDDMEIDDAVDGFVQLAEAWRMQVQGTSEQESEHTTSPRRAGPSLRV